MSDLGKQRRVRLANDWLGDRVEIPEAVSYLVRYSFAGIWWCGGYHHRLAVRGILADSRLGPFCVEQPTKNVQCYSQKTTQVNPGHPVIRSNSLPHTQTDVRCHT